MQAIGLFFLNQMPDPDLRVFGQLHVIVNIFDT